MTAPTFKVHADFVTMTFMLPPIQKTLGKTPDLILQRLAEVPAASIPELARHLGKSDSAIERAIRKLRADGKLVRIGPAKGGHWEVIE